MMNNYDSAEQYNERIQAIPPTLHYRALATRFQELVGVEIIAEGCTGKPHGNNSFVVEVMYTHALVTKFTTLAQHDSIGVSSNTMLP